MSAQRPPDPWPARPTERLAGDAAGVARAAEILRAGGLVAFPTETVYGLGGRADLAASAAGIYAAKGRPSFNPLIAHVPDLEAAERLAIFPKAARALAEAFWPGPLTLVLPRRPGSGLAEAVTAGLPTVAIRVPAHPLARALLAATGAPVAAPSANRSGKVSPTTAAHVLDGLSGRIDAVLDGGACPVGVESTILGFEGETPAVLRPGGLALEAMAETCGRRLEVGAHPPAPPTSSRRPQVSAPGMLASHYAPGAALRLNAEAPRQGEGWLGFGPGPAAAGPYLNLSPSGDVAEAAANLFAHLRALDAAMGGAGTIAVAPVPEAGLGLAVNDRLRRAAAPRTDPLADPFDLPDPDA
ncbi:L-threonylcarbamoyladenylate synthase [Albimonas pacifica]|uniref:Threonylcarbamoyl-AMP synthase n=1 Tax=Albimonas pacifica TaxID=1114924 RepID=A0A1I3F2Y9_9RHOB|nr:L-threonylcarbamoyladenylate synthase [Albimonas pacifica]SFI05520.1 translation factor SUA5 [Albimonas pacifica]